MTFYFEEEDNFVETDGHAFVPDEDGECVTCGYLASRNHHD